MLLRGGDIVKKTTKKIFLFLSFALLAGGCSSSRDSASAGKTSLNRDESASESGKASTAENTTVDSLSTQPENTEPALSTGKTLNIWCVNDELPSKMQFVPGYTSNDSNDPSHGGMLGDVNVKFTFITNADTTYDAELEAALGKQMAASDDEKIDLFVVEDDYALKYFDSGYSEDIHKFVSEEDISEMFKYTKDFALSSKGVIKGVTWQLCPGVLFYNRDIAKEVLGTDEAEEVNKYVKDWETFEETAEKMALNDYLMMPSVNDSYSAFWAKASNKWVDDKGDITIDDALKKWADSSKKLYDMKATVNQPLWDGYSCAVNGGCFCVFGSPWLIDFCFGYDPDRVADGTADMSVVANAGKWAVCAGPQSYYYGGGQWILAAAGSDNVSEISHIIKSLTCDADVMKKIAQDSASPVNNHAVMEEMATDPSFDKYVLGGMNPFKCYMENADMIPSFNKTIDDAKYNTEFKEAMTDYFAGLITYEKAVEECELTRS